MRRRRRCADMRMRPGSPATRSRAWSARSRTNLKALASTDSDQVQLQSLELEVQVSTRTARVLLDKYREAIARDSKDAEPPNARVIETAIQPRMPVFPKKGADPDSRHARWVHSFAVGGRRKGNTRRRRRRSFPSPQPNRLGERRVREHPDFVASARARGATGPARARLARHRGGRGRRDR